MEKLKTEDFPQTYLVVQLSKRVKLQTAQWLVEKIVSEKKRGGAELLVRRQPSSTSKYLMLHISADTDHLLELAEELEIRKTDRHGVLREFMLDQLHEFIDPTFKDELLTSSEKQTIVRHELENIRALPHDVSVCGHSEFPLYEGQSIMSACLHYGIIKQIFPLHDDESVKKFGRSWYLKFLDQQPFEEIRIYFGESIALYFQFLGFYTRALVVPSIFGFIQMMIPPEYLIFFCILNIICASLFLELWRRKCSELAYIWGTISMTSFDEPRANFRGVMGVDAVTGKLLPQSPRFQTNMKMYCVSLPLVFLCMMGAFGVMLISFSIEEQLRIVPDIPELVTYIPSIVYAVFVQVINLVYRQFANFLTEWENHRTQSQFDRHRVTKLVLFEFVNNFMSLFYIAFIMQDIDLLRYQLATLLIVQQVINNFQEAFVPLILRRCAPSKSKNSNSSKAQVVADLSVEELNLYETRVQQAVTEAAMDRYDDPYDDYLELYVQFGYVFLFSAVYPMAAFWAFLNNFLEIRTDAFKLCCVYQRPMARKVKDTGAWQRSFQALCALSIMTNCALLSLSPSLKAQFPGNMSETSWILCFVILEHILLGLRQIVHYAIPDKPEWVRLALAKGNYKAKRALKLQRAMKNRKKSSETEKDVINVSG